MNSGKLFRLRLHYVRCSCQASSSYSPILRAFKRASESGADIRIVYDCKEKGPKEDSIAAILEAGIEGLMIARKSGRGIAHNKFLILLQHGSPISVWTGSMNFTESGIFGQANVGHVINDHETASKYMQYWEQLAGDPDVKELRLWSESATPHPTDLEVGPGVTCIFSPRNSLAMLEWYVKKISSSKAMSCMTAAFGVNKLFAEAFATDPEGLRWLLMEKRGQTFNTFKDVQGNVISIGSFLSEGNLKSTTWRGGDSSYSLWEEEQLTGLNEHVQFLHTKFMLIDPLSGHPTVITGSGNFSNASITNNDENMLIIQDDVRVADIYFTGRLILCSLKCVSWLVFRLFGLLILILTTLQSFTVYSSTGSFDTTFNSKDIQRVLSQSQLILQRTIVGLSRTMRKVLYNASRGSCLALLKHQALRYPQGTRSRECAQTTPFSAQASFSSRSKSKSLISSDW